MSDFSNPEYYYNRELSWLLFNDRILGEARDKDILLMERVKFLSITASNLDEFFMVRVASLKDMVDAGYSKNDIAGLSAKKQLKMVSKRAHELVENQYEVYNKALLPALKKIGLRIVTSHEKLNAEQAEYVDRYFMDNVYPVLTPMAVDSSRKFPHILNKTLNLGAFLKDPKKNEGDEGIDFAMVQVPSVLSRVVEIPGADGEKCVILLEEIIERNINKLFSGREVLCVHPFRIMRNADLSIDEDEAEDLLIEIESKIRMRQWGKAIRLEVSDDMDEKLLKRIAEEHDIEENDIYKINGPLDLTCLMKVYSLEGFDSYKVKKYDPVLEPAFRDEEDIFEAIQKGDILMHHPYESFQPVVDFVRRAAEDENVLAIKQTLYRVSGHSPIIAALKEAAMKGKQVSVLVELKARFDEEHNINWARELEQAGCHVIYGLVGLKTHCKITLVVRREDEGIKRYVHLATGNYNDATAKLYTDLGMFTCKEEYGEDATAVFNMLSGYSEPLHWNKLYLAPLWMKNRFIYMINREKEIAANGGHGHIIAKMNSLCDREIIEALYDASTAGVKIELIIRGICCLKVGIPGVSENITVRSIVGNFLEHSRIYYFYNDGNEEYYLSSADWMPRNLDRRVEILFPVEDPSLRERVMDVLKANLEDTLKAYVLNENGEYKKVDKRGKALFSAQDYFCKEAQKTVVGSGKVSGRTFIPKMKP